ncbi:unnamed protein product [Bursaphelenchus okinawaensis]|uniref:MAM domain-containing protein n=1 Tax=Bursaphelenchus okinawaensis TaxID=465554 RepID=A0A811L6D6_9BILA|nr:unnamed protein product [Bursaphelenchus okinawaensis]CAG9116743.1 unnamed protein product [Bursaphelenchus okinawaensis]
MTLWVILLLGQVPLLLSCQPPLQYSSNAVYGSKTYEVAQEHPISSQQIDQNLQSSFVQEENYSNHPKNNGDLSFNANGIPNFSIEHSMEADEHKHGNEVEHEVAQNGQGMPQNGHKVPQNGQEVPQNGQEMPQNGQEVPQNAQEVPQNALQLPHSGHVFTDGSNSNLDPTQQLQNIELERQIENANRGLGQEVFSGHGEDPRLAQNAEQGHEHHGIVESFPISRSDQQLPIGNNNPQLTQQGLVNHQQNLLNPLPLSPFPIQKPLSQDLARPTNPYPEHHSLQEWSKICAKREPLNFMQILDCIDVWNFNEESNLAISGSTSCDFDGNSVCKFYGKNEEELVFKKGALIHHMNGTVYGAFEESFSTMTKRPLGALPQDGFLVMAEPFGNTPEAIGVVQMDIGCQKGDAMLSFDYWTTVPDVEVKVCTRVDDDRRCTTNIEYAPESSRVEIQVIHTESESFIVEIIVGGFTKPGLFIMDNLVYEANDCSRTEFLKNSKNFDSPMKSLEKDITPSLKPMLEIPSRLIDKNSGLSSNLKIRQINPNTCKAIQCNFEHDLCGYSQPEIEDDVNYGKWQFSKTKIGNIQTDSNTTHKSSHSGFAFVGVDDRGANTKGRTIYILESEEFNLPVDTNMTFDVYKQSNAISLQVCVDELSNCIYEAPPSKAYWSENERVLLPSGTSKVYFVATQWKRFKWLAIDEIKLDFNC